MPKTVGFKKNLSDSNKANIDLIQVNRKTTSIEITDVTPSSKYLDTNFGHDFHNMDSLRITP